MKGLDPADDYSRSVKAADHTVAVGTLMEWIEERNGRAALTAVGHRVAHGDRSTGNPSESHRR